jgi:uncharacterized membrane protein YhhN
LLALLALVFIVREAAVYKGMIRLKYLFTPLVTFLILCLVIASISRNGMSGYRSLILCALILSLIADTMLMIIEVNLLSYGILYFASAHVLYIIAFSDEYAFNLWNLVPAVILTVFVAFFYLKIRGKTKGLDVPVLIYSIIVSLMAFFAVSSLDSRLSRKAVLISSGALLFIVSDSLLAYFSFIKPNKYESVISWAFYAPAQFMMALSCFY